MARRRNTGATPAGARRMGRRRAGRGALTILALFLATSGALKLGQGVGTAMALMPEEDTSPTPPVQCAEPPATLAAALAEKAAQIGARDAAITERQAALALAEQVIADRLAALKAAEESLTATIARTDGAAEGDVSRLTAIYEAMRPTDAAAIFQAMAPDFAAGFLGRMRPEAAAAVLGGMSPEAAYGISAQIAGRNARAPKN